MILIFPLAHNYLLSVFSHGSRRWFPVKCNLGKRHGIHSRPPVFLRSHPIALAAHWSMRTQIHRHWLILIHCGHRVPFFQVNLNVLSFDIDVLYFSNGQETSQIAPKRPITSQNVPATQPSTRIGTVI